MVTIIQICSNIWFNCLKIKKIILIFEKENKTPRLTEVSDRYGVWTWLEGFKAMGEATRVR